MNGAFTLLTIGLSEHELTFPSGTPTRQELLLSFHDRYSALNPQGLIALVALEQTTRRKALARGEVLGPSGPLFPGFAMEALYASLPAYAPDDFAVCHSTVPATHFMWLVPISAVEASFVRRRGWNSFEDHLVNQDPDLLDLERLDITLSELRLTE